MSITLKKVSYYYNQKTPSQRQVLKDIDLNIQKGEFIALIGETGSGKSTLVQQLNGLLIPSFGKLTFEDDQTKTVIYDIQREPSYDKKLNPVFYKDKKIKNIKELRKRVGMVFQFPEYQLFETNVLTDVSYGPKNFGLKKEEAEEKAKQALELVGLDSSYFKRSPFELSGGEKRKVAIAGIIAMNPDYLVLDEPTAGLDPVGEKNMMELFKKISDTGTTIILVTHNMDIVMEYCNKVCVVEDGRISSISTPLELFQNDSFVKLSSIDAPYFIKVARELINHNLPIDIKKVKSIKTLADEIRRVIK